MLFLQPQLPVQLLLMIQPQQAMQILLQSHLLVMSLLPLTQLLYQKR